MWGALLASKSPQVSMFTQCHPMIQIWAEEATLLSLEIHQWKNPLSAGKTSSEKFSGCLPHLRAVVPSSPNGYALGNFERHLEFGARSCAP